MPNSAPLGSVLIVDDYPDRAKPVQLLVEQLGYQCIYRQTAAEAIGVLREHDVNLALVDNDLGADGSGNDLLDRIAREFPGVEGCLFTTRHERKKDMPNYKRMKYRIICYTQRRNSRFMRDLLKGVNAGLRRRLDWLQRVTSNAGIGYAVIRADEGIVFSGPEQKNLPANLDEWAKREQLAPNELQKLKSSVSESLFSQNPVANERGEKIDCTDGRRLTCYFRPLPPEDRFAGDDEKYGLLFTRDVTQATQDLERFTNVDRLANDLLVQDQFENIASDICNGAVRLLGFKRARLWILEADTHTLMLFKEHGHNLTVDAKSLCRVDCDENPSFKKLLFERQPLTHVEIVTNAVDYHTPEVVRILKLDKVKETFAIPLIVHRQVDSERKDEGHVLPLGLLTLDKYDPDSDQPAETDPKGKDVRIGRRLGWMAAAALNRSIHEWQLHRFETILTQTQLSDGKQGVEGVDKALQPVYESIIKSLGNDPTAPWLYPLRGAEIAVRPDRYAPKPEYQRIYVTPTEEPFVPKTIDVTRGLMGHLFREISNPESAVARGEPQFIPDIFQVDGFREYSNNLLLSECISREYMAYLENYPTKIIIPLMDLDGRLLGFMCFHTTRRWDTQKPSESYLRWLEVLGRVCSRILEIRERHLMAHDVMDKMHEKLLSKGALSDIGEMSSTLTHELKHFFQELICYPDLIKRQISAGDRAEADLTLANIEDVIDRANERLDSLTRVYKGMKSAGGAELGEVLDNSRKIIERDLNEANAELMLNLVPEQILLPLEKSLALVVFNNLLKNACHAIREANRNRGEIQVIAQVAGQVIRIECQDNGIGIREEHRNRLFEIGFTTKAATRGSGAGLTMLKKIIEENNGTIEVVSEFGVGTNFIIELPALT
ncbi:MAG: hypothetical protein JWM11_6101 [Planctomycetaceae bacterium]|nr:hypothetical protein [Planctomycetaceae bacterium]